MKLKAKKKLKYLAPVPFVILVICIGYFVKPLIQNASNKDQAAVPVTETVNHTVPETGATYQEDQSEELPPALQETEEDTESKAGNQTDEHADGEPSLEGQPEEIMMLSSDPLMLHDLYAERGETAFFQCFDAEAEDYIWEYYDMTVRDWAEMEVISGYDDLGRQVSGVVIEASDENNGTMLRCRILYPDGREVTETACLYVLNKAITGISAEEVSMDAEHYASVHRIPVLVEYADGTTEEITGLSGLHFLKETEQSVAEGVSFSGNYTETITTTIAEVDYLYTGYGENIVRLRYHPRGVNEKKLDIETMFHGTDQNPPVISQVDLSDYRISADSDSVEIMVTVLAEDDITPYPMLQYAVLPKGQELTEEDWRNRNCFHHIFDQNGTWVIYCRDQYGNIGSYERDMIVSDHEAPEILSVTLAQEGWQPSNTIQVDAEDVLSVTYSFSCAETGEDSGFIAQNCYEITQNGTWTVRVKDAAGNVSTRQIYVSSIDGQSPIILGITTQQNNREVN